MLKVFNDSILGSCLIDESLNIASIKYWGGVVVAAETLRSLENCYRCTNCINCKFCIFSRECRDCWYCADCDRCTDCDSCSYTRNVHKGRNLLHGNRVDDFKIPRLNPFHRVVLAEASKPDQLEMRTWHTCDTTHCWAGWITHLARLRHFEEEWGVPFLALQVARKSDPLKLLRPADFYGDNETALRRLHSNAAIEGLL